MSGTGFRSWSSLEPQAPAFEESASVAGDGSAFFWFAVSADASVQMACSSSTVRGGVGAGSSLAGVSPSCGATCGEAATTGAASVASPGGAAVGRIDGVGTAGVALAVLVAVSAVLVIAVSSSLIVGGSSTIVVSGASVLAVSAVSVAGSTFVLAVVSCIVAGAGAAADGAALIDGVPGADESGVTVATVPPARCFDDLRCLVCFASRGVCAVVVAAAAAVLAAAVVFAAMPLVGAAAAAAAVWRCCAKMLAAVEFAARSDGDWKKGGLPAEMPPAERNGEEYDAPVWKPVCMKDGLDVNDGGCAYGAVVNDAPPPNGTLAANGDPNSAYGAG